MRLYQILLAAIGLLYGWVGIASTGIASVLALTGGAAIIAAAVLAGRRLLAAGLLLVGVLPLAIVTWWSIATPLLACVALLLAIPVIGRRHSPET